MLDLIKYTKEITKCETKYVSYIGNKIFIKSKNNKKVYISSSFLLYENICSGEKVDFPKDYTKNFISNKHSYQKALFKSILKHIEHAYSFQEGFEFLKLIKSLKCLSSNYKIRAIIASSIKVFFDFKLGKFTTYDLEFFKDFYFFSKVYIRKELHSNYFSGTFKKDFRIKFFLDDNDQEKRFIIQYALNTLNLGFDHFGFKNFKNLPNSIKFFKSFELFNYVYSLYTEHNIYPNYTLYNIKYKKFVPKKYESLPVSSFFSLTGIHMDKKIFKKFKNQQEIDCFFKKELIVYLNNTYNFSFYEDFELKLNKFFTQCNKDNNVDKLDRN